MAAGNNILVDVVSFSYPIDDYIGGAQPTGTVSYPNLYCRYEPVSPTIALLEQGVITTKLFYFFINRADVLITENDELKIKAPLNHVYINQYFRIVAVQKTGFHPSDNRGFLKLTTKRRETANAIQSV